MKFPQAYFSWAHWSDIHKFVRLVLRAVIVMGLLYVFAVSVTIAFAAEDSPAQETPSETITVDPSPPSDEHADPDAEVSTEGEFPATDEAAESDTDPATTPDEIETTQIDVDPTSAEGIVPEADITEAVAPDSAPEV
nr:hypothetical protein [Chloroflexota bacterium]